MTFMKITTRECTFSHTEGVEKAEKSSSTLIRDKNADVWGFKLFLCTGIQQWVLVPATMGLIFAVPRGQQGLETKVN